MLPVLHSISKTHQYNAKQTISAEPPSVVPFFTRVRLIVNEVFLDVQVVFRDLHKCDLEFHLSETSA